MARLFIDGFNSGDASLWDTVSGLTGVNFIVNKPGFGPYCLQLGSNQSFATKNLGSQKSELYVKVRLQADARGGSQYSSFGFRANNTAIAYLGWINDFVPKFVTANADSGGTTRATSPNAFVVGKVYLIEMYFKPLNSASGRFTLKVDGATWIDWTGISTYDTEYCDEIRLGANNNMVTNTTFYSDLVIDDAAWIGNTRVGYRQVNGVGNANQFTPVPTGNNFANVDEITPDALDFNWSNTDEQQDMLALGSLQVGTGAYSVNSIKCVAVNGIFKKTGTPTPTILKAGVRLSGTDDFKGSHAPPTTSGPFQDIWETKPGGGAWATTDDFQAGYKVT